MTPEQQRIAIAESVGWKVELDKHGAYVLISPTGERLARSREPSATLQDFSYMLPDYDLNAMHEVEKTLTSPQAGDYDMWLWILLKREWDESGIHTPAASWHATATQRAEAYLRTIGKWADSPPQPPGQP